MGIPFSEEAYEVLTRIIDHVGYDPCFAAWEAYPEAWHRARVLFVQSLPEEVPVGPTVWAREDKGKLYVLLVDDESEGKVNWAQARVPCQREIADTATVGWAPVEYDERETYLPWFSTHLANAGSSLACPAWLTDILSTLR